MKDKSMRLVSKWLLSIVAVFCLVAVSTGGTASAQSTGTWTAQWVNTPSCKVGVRVTSANWPADYQIMVRFNISSNPPGPIFYVPVNGTFTVANPDPSVYVNVSVRPVMANGQDLATPLMDKSPQAVCLSPQPTPTPVPPTPTPVPPTPTPELPTPTPVPPTPTPEPPTPTPLPPTAEPTVEPTVTVPATVVATVPPTQVSETPTPEPSVTPVQTVVATVPPVQTVVPTETPVETEVAAETPIATEVPDETEPVTELVVASPVPSTTGPTDPGDPTAEVVAALPSTGDGSNRTTWEAGALAIVAGAAVAGVAALLSRRRAEQSL